MNRKLFIGVTAVLAIGLVGRAIADGIPTVTPLTYSGALQNAAGTPITTAQSIQLTLWDDASANASTNQKCVTPTQNVQPDAQGRFQIKLDQACFDAVKANPNLWVQLQIGAVVLPRTKINAVPYAIESGRSTRQVITYGEKRRTVFGQYCGATATVSGAVSASGGAVSGYPATKILCEQTCSSPTAHICSGHEVTASYELGLNPPTGWVATSSVANQGGTVQVDCYGFQNNVAPNSGAAWENTYVEQRLCDVTKPILCCD